MDGKRNGPFTKKTMNLARQAVSAELMRLQLAVEHNRDFGRHSMAEEVERRRDELLWAARELGAATGLVERRMARKVMP